MTKVQNMISELIAKYKKRINEADKKFGYIVLTNEIINDLEELNK